MVQRLSNTLLATARCLTWVYLDALTFATCTLMNHRINMFISAEFRSRCDTRQILDRFWVLMLVEVDSIVLIKPAWPYQLIALIYNELSLSLLRLYRDRRWRIVAIGVKCCVATTGIVIKKHVRPIFNKDFLAAFCWAKVVGTSIVNALWHLICQFIIIGLLLLLLIWWL